MTTSRFDLVTFDVYSALYDLNTSLLPSLEPICGEAAQRLLSEWRRLQLQYTLISTLIGKGHVPFRVVTRRSLDVALHRFGLQVTEEVRRSLVAAWDNLVPWTEVPEVLRAVRVRGYPIAVLSNGDSVMLAAVTRNVGVSFDYVFSADMAGVYKPHPAIYRLPVERLGLAPSRILHVAGSARDVMGAKAAGLSCFWVNRTKDRVLDPQLDADATASDLWGVLEILK